MRASIPRGLTAKISCPLRPVVVADTRRWAGEEAIQYKYKGCGDCGGGERLRSDG